ncbi:hypothetical protein [Streptomyces olivoreticuli]|uniref:hypothetical protein n=1 Tax=Streptomyces olivoreticuli TaxID=68246 RepID=UPI000E28387F|nr:hypothetical protein [Streptomyces olivoreticuli]
MRHHARATAAILGTAAALGLAAPSAVAAPEAAPSSAVRMHSGAYGGCLTAEGSGYRDPRGAARPWLVALQACDTSTPDRQSWIYSPATHQFSSVAEPYRCIDRQGSQLVTALCDADEPEQRFRTAQAAPGGLRKVVSEADGRIWAQDSHRAGAARSAKGEGVREARDAASVPADRGWALTGV